MEKVKGNFLTLISIVHKHTLYVSFAIGLPRGADKSLAQPTSRCILFDGENILFAASLIIYVNSTNIPPIMIINKINEHQKLLLL